VDTSSTVQQAIRRWGIQPGRSLRPLTACVRPACGKAIQIEIVVGPDWLLVSNPLRSLDRSALPLFFAISRHRPSLRSVVEECRANERRVRTRPPPMIYLRQTSVVWLC